MSYGVAVHLVFAGTLALAALLLTIVKKMSLQRAAALLLTEFCKPRTFLPLAIGVWLGWMLGLLIL